MFPPLNGKPMGGYVERVAPGSFPLWKDKAPILGALDLELTERCNNDCVHCCINLPAQDTQLLRGPLFISCGHPSP